MIDAKHLSCAHGPGCACNMMQPILCRYMVVHFVKNKAEAHTKDRPQTNRY